MSSSWPHMPCDVPETTISTTESSFFFTISDTVSSLPVASPRFNSDSSESTLSFTALPPVREKSRPATAPSMALTIMVMIMKAARVPRVTYFFSFFLFEEPAGAAWAGPSGAACAGPSYGARAGVSGTLNTASLCVSCAAVSGTSNTATSDGTGPAAGSTTVSVRGTSAGAAAGGVSSFHSNEGSSSLIIVFLSSMSFISLMAISLLSR